MEEEWSSEWEGASAAESEEPTEGWLLPGEKVLVREPWMGYLSLLGKRLGAVTLTNYRLRFHSREAAGSPKGPTKAACILNVPLGMIASVSKMGYSTVSRGDDAYGIEVVCKDFSRLKLSSQKEGHARRALFEALQRPSKDFSRLKLSSQKEGHARRALFEALQRQAFPLTSKLPFFAFEYEERFGAGDGWALYDPHQEYRRMGVPEDIWRPTRANERYELCETYPPLLWVPAAAAALGPDYLAKVAAHRTKGRLPVLSWVSREGGASLCRSSQPATGMVGRRSQEDEGYLQQIVEANAQSARLFIADARPEVNAKVNKAKGGGYESEEAYPFADLAFLDIGNIHVMRQSLTKAFDACYPRVDEKTFLSAVDDSNWLSHLKILLLGAAKIADRIHNQKESVLVHCSDGWDRTAQLTSLASLLLDPYYRTLRGFAVLVEKEWCSFGHKFAHRLGHGEDKAGNEERSPVFLQFLHAVHQLTVFFPTAFQFNEFFLLRIADEMFTCRFGTFLYNCDRTRVKERVRERTQSVWSLLLQEEAYLRNPLYSEPSTAVVLLTPPTTLRRIQLWKAYFLRHNPAHSPLHQAEAKMDLYRQISAVRAALEDEVRRMSVGQEAQAPPLTPTA